MTTAAPKVAPQDISEQLRARLMGRASRYWDAEAAHFLDVFLRQLARTEHLLLPRKKQRSFEELRWALGRYASQAIRKRDMDRLDVVRTVLSLLRPEDPNERAAEASEGLLDRSAVDLSALAEHWLDLICPVWYEHLRQPRRIRPLRLKDLRPTLTGEGRLSTEQLRELTGDARWVRPVDEQVVAAVVGVPAEARGRVEP